MPIGPLWGWIGLDTIAAQLDQIESKIDRLLAGQQQGKALLMSEQEEITNLVQQVAANKSAVDSARVALEGFVAQVSSLTDQLNAAIANGGDVSPDIKAAADALAANTEALNAAIPALAEAVKANTAG